MAIVPITDPRQKLSRPAGRAIGFANTKQQFDAVALAMQAAGYPDSKIIALYGDAGIKMLERLQPSFNFGDGEDDIIEFAIQELQDGHYALATEVKDRAEALQVVAVSEPHGHTASATSGPGSTSC